MVILYVSYLPCLKTKAFLSQYLILCFIHATSHAAWYIEDTLENVCGIINEWIPKLLLIGVATFLQEVKKEQEPLT